MLSKQEKLKLDYLYGSVGSVNSIKKELLSSAQNAVSIGFYLREIESNEYWIATDFYKNFKSVKYTTSSGTVKFTKYTFYDYCKDEFNFSRRSVDRYINIHFAFAKVNGPVRTKFIDEKYKDYNCSQLAEMLYLNDKQLKKVNPDMSVREISALKNDDVPDQDEVEPDVSFFNKDAAIDVNEVDITFDKDFEDKTFKKKKYRVCGLLYDKFVSTPAQYSQQFIKLQEFLNQGYLARIVLYSPVEEKKDGEEIA